MAHLKQSIISVLVLAVLLPTSPWVVTGQSVSSEKGREQFGERGLPFPSEHYAPPEYGQYPQNWSVVQDRQGIVYVANNNGVLQYDGERWRLIPTTTGTTVRSLAIDSLVFVGAKGDFGYLRPDSVGLKRYRSLYEHIPEGKRDFDDVWATHVTPQGTYFQANDRLFRWDGNTISSWSSTEGFHTSFTVDSTLYVREIGRGLVRMREDSLTRVPGGKAFSDTPIYMMAPHPSGQVLIATRNMGLQLFDGRNLQAFAPQVTSYLQENDLYHGCRLPGGRYALATLGGGVLIVGSEGRVLRVLDQTSGLPDEVVNHLYPGRGGHLWMALNNEGVYRTDLSAATTLFDERTGLEGTIRSIERHEGTLYVATGRGLHVLRKNDNGVLGGGTASFTVREDLPLVWNLLSVGESLFAATENGVYRIENGVSERIDGGHTFALSESDDGVLYAGTRSGLMVLRRSEGTWDGAEVQGSEEYLRSVASKSGKAVWASTSDGDVLRYSVAEGFDRVASKERFGPERGLPDGFKSPIFINQKIAVRSREGIFQITNPKKDPSEWQFQRRSSLLPGTDTDSLRTIRAFHEDDRGRLWVATGNRVYGGRAGQDQQGYKWKRLQPLHFPKRDPVRFHVEEHQRIWLGAGQRLVRFAGTNITKQVVPTPAFQALVRRVVSASDGKVVYGGTGDEGRRSSVLSVPYVRNDLRFEVAAPFYGTTDSHQYQYKLSGHSDGWSAWQDRAYTTYTNLWEGTYRFHVRARSDRGDISETEVLVLKVQAPWYRSAGAYLAYGILILLLGMGFRHYYRLKQEREHARKQARQLTQEREAKRRLKRANQRLREANQLKEEFLANTSHELRTPLTNILGFINVLRDTATEEQEEFLTAIEENGKRLKRTLRALLDLSRLRSETGEPDLDPIPVADHVKSIASDFRETAEEKELDFHIEGPGETVYGRADERYLEQILRNLIENAIKFTNEGHIAVLVSATDRHVEVAVEDTGIGIDEEFLPRLFEDFKQESKGKGRSFEGFGLGLAISSRMATLMGADISVQSKKGEGSTFTLRLRRGDTAANKTLFAEDKVLETE